MAFLYNGKKREWPYRSAQEYLTALKWRWRITFLVVAGIATLLGLLFANHPEWWVWREIEKAPWAVHWLIGSLLWLIPLSPLFSLREAAYSWEKKMIKRDGLDKWFANLQLPEVE